MSDIILASLAIFGAYMALQLVAHGIAIGIAYVCRRLKG